MKEICRCMGWNSNFCKDVTSDFLEYFAWEEVWVKSAILYTSTIKIKIFKNDLDFLMDL